MLGVVLGSLVGRLASARRKPFVLAFIAALLALAALAHTLGGRIAPVFAMTLAMGAENAVFERDGEVTIGLTYMTGTLVKFGQRLTGALLGEDRFAWASYLQQWIGLALGALTGALAFPFWGLSALWIAGEAAALLAFVAGQLGPDPDL